MIFNMSHDFSDIETYMFIINTTKYENKNILQLYSNWLDIYG